MTIVYWLSAAALLIIAIITCYTDSRFGRIPNQVILFGLFYAISLYAFLLIYNFGFVYNPVNVAYVAKMFTNGLTALLVGFLLWKLNFWSAGDAKLFAVYAAIIPLESYAGGAVQQFLSFNLLVNLFFPMVLILGAKATAFAFLSLIQSVKKGSFLLWLKGFFSKENVARELKGLAESLLDFIFMFTVFSGFFSIITLALGGETYPNPFIIYFCMLFFSSKLNKLKSEIRILKKGIQFFSLAYLSYFVIVGNYSHLKGILLFSLLFMFAISLTRRVLNIYVQRAEVKDIRVHSLKEGMVIHQDELEVVKKMAKDAGRESELESIGQGGIKKSQIDLVRELFKDREDTIFRVYNSFPFAPYLSLSAILTFTTKASFLNLMATLVNNN